MNPGTSPIQVKEETALELTDLIFNTKTQTGMLHQLFGIMQAFVVGWGVLTDTPKGSRRDGEHGG